MIRRHVPIPSVNRRGKTARCFSVTFRLRASNRGPVPTPIIRIRGARLRSYLHIDSISPFQSDHLLAEASNPVHFQARYVLCLSLRMARGSPCLRGWNGCSTPWRFLAHPCIGEFLSRCSKIDHLAGCWKCFETLGISEKSSTISNPLRPSLRQTGQSARSGLRIPSGVFDLLIAG
jgi:hypothetical protein